MIRYLLFWALLALPAVAGAQDLFDLGHTVRYADYLRQEERYLAARREYRRALALSGPDTTLLRALMVAYRLDNLPDSAQRVALTYYPDTVGFPVTLAAEYLLALLDDGRYERAYRTAARSASLPGATRHDWQIGTTLLQHRWAAARTEISRSPFAESEWQPLAERGARIRYRKPWLATSLSAVVPGTGRMYAGRWADGILSAITVGLSAWQAYRGFDERGARSFYGWFNAFFGASFYIGNLYGSHRAAVIYNEKANQQVTDLVDRRLRVGR